MAKIGVLAVQGAFHEHAAMLRTLLQGHDEGGVIELRRPGQLESLDGIVLPGGESTTIEKLLDSSGLRKPLRDAIETGTPTLATCAGAILVASQGDEQVDKTDTRLLGLVDAEIERNAFGRQRESFEGQVDAPSIGDAAFPGVFIRAPAFRRVWGKATPWAQLPEGDVVGVEQGNILALTFHPELSNDARIHRYFLDKISTREAKAP